MAKIKVEDLELLKPQHQELCQQLNMDKETEELSWRMFAEVSQRHTLQGDTLHWFCCSLFAACRSSLTPTVADDDSMVMGNCVSLTKLLRCCNISIYEFFENIKHWHELSDLPTSFITQVDRLQRMFSITYHLFQNYANIFDKLFLTPRNEKTCTKFRSARCPSSKLYELCWCLFLCAKSESPNYTVDIVTSFHLLICCIDLLYRNALAEQRLDLINPAFEGVPEQWNTAEFQPANMASYCIITPLCKIAHALPLEAKSMKSGAWQAIIARLFKTQTVHGDAKSCLDIMSSVNFERNLRSLNKCYEQYILSVGEIDERILLQNPRYQQAPMAAAAAGGDNQELQTLIPNTPLTRKNSLPKKECVKEPVANATNNVSKLQELAQLTDNGKKWPEQFRNQLGEDIIKKLEGTMESMHKQFSAAFPAEAEKRFDLAKSLYYYLLDKILSAELKSKPETAIRQLLQNDVLPTNLMACCVEIVLDAYDCNKYKFPWILNCFKVDAFHFSKIIEPVVSSHDGVLTRALIKHLNWIEETCLEKLCWSKQSPLWDIVRQSGSTLPSWSQVDVRNARVHVLATTASPAATSQASVHHRSAMEHARRDLFSDNNNSSTTSAPATTSNEGGKTRFSLKIFLRKFYKLAWLRISELCRRLQLEDELVLQHIWTLFEYSITHTMTLMQDRHLDQLLMCAIYLYIKISDIKDANKTFANIMTLYRHQPQANSSIYREVLIKPASGDTPAHVSDLIYFYNNIYVKHMSPYALDFNNKKKNERDLLLSPHPTDGRVPLPKRVSNFDFHVQPMEKCENFRESPHAPTYVFQKSPAKDLERINELVRHSKRTLPFTDEAVLEKKRFPEQPPRHFDARVSMIMKDRQEECK